MEVLQVMGSDLRPPSAWEARIKILFVPAGLPGVEARYGRPPFPPKIPFTPGYAIVGTLGAVGRRVAQAQVGDDVYALTAYGGYARYICLSEKQLVPVALDPVEAPPLILN